MELDVKSIMNNSRSNMEKTTEHLLTEFSKLRAGKAMPSMLEGVMVQYYGSAVPLQQVASVNTPDAKTIVIQPWEKGTIPDIEKGIMAANLGMNPQNDGTQILISLPPLTEERRQQIVKQIKVEAENAKVGIRSARKDANESIKKMQKDGLSEDEAKAAEGDVQKLTDQYIKRIDQLTGDKEKEVLTV
jgi:ribosome recycling factor